MSRRIKAMLVSMGVGSFLTFLVLVLNAAILKVGVFELATHPLVIALTPLLWLMYTLMLWGFLFAKLSKEESFLSPRLFKSFSLGLIIVLLNIGLMFFYGKTNPTHILALSDIRNLNAAGTMFMLILFSGLLFINVFNPKKKISD